MSSARLASPCLNAPALCPLNSGKIRIKICGQLLILELRTKMCVCWKRFLPTFLVLSVNVI